jgi:hypothetical protein
VFLSANLFYYECYKAIYGIQKSFPKWAKVLPEIKRVRSGQKQLNAHLHNIIPIVYSEDHETGWFQYHQFLEYMLEKNGLLPIINDPNTTNPVIVAVTFDGGKSAVSFPMLRAGSSKWIIAVLILRKVLRCSVKQV